MDINSFALGFNTGKKKGGDKTVIDVPELPIENIEEGKIYRVTKESEIEFWLSTSTFNKPLTEYVLDMTKVNMTFPVHVVESLPDAMEPMDQTTFVIPCYVVESTGIAYISADGTSANANPISSALGFPMTDGGWVDSVDDIVYPGETTVYTVRGQSSTTYGIPDEANNKTVMEHNGSEWVECKAGGGVELNIAYGDTPPEDTSKLWVKTGKANKVIVSLDKVYENGARQESLTALSTKLPYSVQGAASALVGDKIYIFGGRTRNTIYNTIVCFDTVAKTATTIETKLQTQRYDIACAAVGKNIYLFGGGTSTSAGYTTYGYYYVSVFDTETLELRTLDVGYGIPNSAYGGAFGGKMGVRRIGCAVVGEVIYLFGGSTQDVATEKYLSWISRFDTTTETFIQGDVGSLPQLMCYQACVTVGTDIYLFAGRVSSNDFNGIYRYNTITFEIEELPKKLPSGGAYHTAVVDGAKIYVFGHTNRYIHCYDTEKGIIYTLPKSFPYTNYGQTAQQVGDTVYSFGGSSGDNGSTYIIEFLLPIGNFTLEKGKVQIAPQITANIFPFINSDTMQVELGVKEVFKGDGNNQAEPVEAALYKDGTWTTI